MSRYEYYEEDDNASGRVGAGAANIMSKIMKCSQDPSDPECQEMKSGVEPAPTTENYQDYYPYRMKSCGRKKMYGYDGGQCKCSRWNWFFLLLLIVIIVMLVSLCKKNKK